MPTSLAPNDSTDLRINWGGQRLTDWDNVTGRLTYRDIHGGMWQTEFQIFVANLGRRFVNMGDTLRLAADPPVIRIGKTSLWRRIPGWVRTR